MIEGLIVLLVTVVLSIIGAIVAGGLQQRAWEVQHRRSIEDAQLVRAQIAVDRLIELSDRRLYRLRRALWSLSPDTTIDKTRAMEDYRVAVCDWNDNFGFLRANLLSLYGFSRVLEFEEQIHGNFQRLGAALEHSIKNSIAPAASTQHELDVFAKNCYAFTARLQQSVRDRTLPHFESLDGVEYQNTDRLSSIYLIKRLYGVSTKLRRV